MKQQVNNLAHAAAESIKINAFVKAQTLIDQLVRIHESLAKAADQAAADYQAAKRGKKAAAKSTAKAAAEIANDTAKVIESLNNTLALAKAAAAADKAAAAKAAAEKQAKAAAAAAAEKTAAKAVTAAAARGLNQFRNSYKGLLRDVANDIHVNGKDSLYLKQITWAVYGGLNTDKVKGEASDQYITRALKNGQALTDNLDITRTLLADYLARPQKMFKLFCDTLPCVEIARDAQTGKVTTAFAKAKVIAYCADKASIQIKEDSDKYSRIIINDSLYYVLNEYADLDLAAALSDKGDKVMSRRRINAEKADQNRYYIQGGNIVTLIPSDRVNFTQLLPALAGVCSAGALQSYDNKAKAAAAKAAAAKAAAKATA